MKVAVDGYSSTGKSTVARIIAEKLGLIYIDTGAMYRAVTLFALRNGMFDGEKLDTERLESRLSDIVVGFVRNEVSGAVETTLNGEPVEKEIRGMDVSDKVSIVAAVKSVRSLLVRNQRQMSEGTDVIMDGRDIGTVVFPDADIKFFLTASPEVRAVRRFDELLATGERVSMEEVRENIEKRDYIDTHRDESPLVQAEDAVVIDNGELTVEQEVAMMVSMIQDIRS